MPNRGPEIPGSSWSAYVYRQRIDAILTCWLGVMAGSEGRVQRGRVLMRSQKVFHLLDDQEGNKIFDVCLLLELVPFGAQHLFNFGHWIRKRFGYVLRDAVPV